jgi:hypothetical protein
LVSSKEEKNEVQNLICALILDPNTPFKQVVTFNDTVLCSQWTFLNCNQILEQRSELREKAYVIIESKSCFFFRRVEEVIIYDKFCLNKEQAFLRMRGATRKESRVW